MNSCVWVVWAAQGSSGYGSKEKSQFEFSLAIFQGGYFNFSGAIVFLNIVASALR